MLIDLSIFIDLFNEGIVHPDFGPLWGGGGGKNLGKHAYMILARSLKEDSPLIKNLLLLGRCSGRKRKKFRRSF